MLQLPAHLDAGLELGLAGLLPAPQPPEHGEVEQQHDGAGDEEGADGGVDDVVVILQLALAGVAPGHAVDAEHDGGRHGQGQEPGGGQQHDLTVVHVFAVVVQGYGHGDEPGGRIQSVMGLPINPWNVT